MVVQYLMPVPVILNCGQQLFCVNNNDNDNDDDDDDNSKNNNYHHHHHHHHHHVQTNSGAHSSSYPMGTRGSFPGGKAAWP